MLKTQVQRRDGNINVSFLGRFDDHLAEQLTEIQPRLTGAHVVFDLAGVQTVNSYGFKQWIKFLEALDKVTTFEFINCSLPVVEFCSLLPETSFSDRMVSAAVPYECEECRRQMTLVLEVDQFSGGKDFEPAFCQACNGALVPLFSSRDYFDFIRPRRAG